MPNDLEIIGNLPITSLRDPAEILAEAGERAKALKEMVKQTRSSKMIGNKEHLQIEAWATIGSFYGCAAGADASEPFEIDGVRGARAHARVVHKETGKVISEAISYCMRDEDNWAHKPFFQLSSMAQTRACSKALANAFRWVVVMAGYATTPAEEMTGNEYDTRKPVPQTRLRNDATMVQAADRYTGEPTRQEEAAGVGTGGADHTAQQASDAPAPKAQTAAELIGNITDKMQDQYEDGMIGNLQPYQGTKNYQPKVKPGYFDLEDGQGGLVKRFKYFDPTMELTSGLKRVYYRTENYQGKVSYAATKIESLE